MSIDKEYKCINNECIIDYNECFTGIVFENICGSFYNNIKNLKIIITNQEVFNYEFDLGTFYPLCKNIIIDDNNFAIMLPQNLLLNLNNIITMDSQIKIIVKNYSKNLTNIRIFTHTNNINDANSICIVEKSKLHTAYNKAYIKGFIVCANIGTLSKFTLIIDNNEIKNYDKTKCILYTEYISEIQSFYIPMNTMVSFKETSCNGSIAMHENINLIFNETCKISNIYYVLCMT